MEIEIKDVSLNLLTAEQRVEITVTTATGQVLIFPSAQVESRTTPSASGVKSTIYAFAQKTETLPTPRVFTFFLEQEDGCPPRHRLDESPV